MRLLNPARWQTWVALAMLSWALLDLTVPGFCTDEEESFPPPESTAAQTVNPGSTIARGAAQVSGTDPLSRSQNRLDDGCWCCCSHVVPSPHFQTAILSSLDLQELPVFESQSLGSFSPPYHPPRS
jgi:hypothetical protein